VSTSLGYLFNNDINVSDNVAIFKTRRGLKKSQEGITDEFYVVK